jgi:hypothetical protein
MSGGSCCDAPAPQWLDVYGAGVRPRRHGFECPADVFQVTAWATILVLMVSFYMLHLPFLESNSQAGLIVVVSAMAILTITLKVLSSLANNEDPTVFADGPRLDAAALASTPPEGTESCYYCRRFVILGSKHCSVCDKCVLGFDHHCRWLNSCVGSRTYPLFFSFVLSATLSISLVSGIGIYFIVDALRDKQKYLALLEANYHHISYNAYIFFLFAFAVYGCIAAVAVGNLFCFHVYLIITKQTTYQWILAKRDKKMRETGIRQSRASDGCCPEKKRRIFSKKKPQQGGSETVMDDSAPAHEPTAAFAVEVAAEPASSNVLPNSPPAPQP